MPKATRTPTTLRRATGVAGAAAPPAKAAAAPPTDALVRMLWMASETDEGWRRRSSTNKAMCAVTGAAERLGGLSKICWDLCFAEMSKGGLRAQDGPASVHSFLARTLADLSRGLKDAHRLVLDDVDAVDDAKPRTRRTGA